MNVQSGPPVLTAVDVRDHYESDPPRMLLAAFCIAGALFLGSLAAGAIYLIRTRL